MCKLCLVTRTIRIRSKVDHAPLSVSLLSRACKWIPEPLVRGFPDRGKPGRRVRNDRDSHVTSNYSTVSVVGRLYGAVCALCHLPYAVRNSGVGAGGTAAITHRSPRPQRTRPHHLACPSDRSCSLIRDLCALRVPLCRWAQPQGGRDACEGAIYLYAHTTQSGRGPRGSV